MEKRTGPVGPESLLKTILLIDDESTVRNELEVMLSHIRRKRLSVSDLSMPGMCMTEGPQQFKQSLTKLTLSSSPVSLRTSHWSNKPPRFCSNPSALDEFLTVAQRGILTC